MNTTSMVVRSCLSSTHVVCNSTLLAPPVSAVPCTSVTLLISSCLVSAIILCSKCVSVPVSSVTTIWCCVPLTFILLGGLPRSSWLTRSDLLTGINLLLISPISPFSLRLLTTSTDSLRLPPPSASLTWQLSLILSITTFNYGLRVVLDLHAPIRTQTVTLRPVNRWMTTEILDSKTKLRHFEHCWRSRQLAIDFEIFQTHLLNYSKMLKAARTLFSSTEVRQCRGDMRALYRLVGDLLESTTKPSLPTRSSDQEVADGLNHFFCSKVSALTSRFHSDTGPPTFAIFFGPPSFTCGLLAKFGAFMILLLPSALFSLLSSLALTMPVLSSLVFLALCSLSCSTSARLIFRVRKRDSIRSHLRSLNWLCVNDRITFRIATLTYRCLNGSAPTYLTRLIIPLENSRSLRSSLSALLRDLRTHYVNLGDRSFAKVAPSIWNRLPFAVRNATTLPKFRSILFKQRFNWCVLCFFCDS